MNFLKLKAWFLETKRNLPWREGPSPYAVWISEVMLQQTQVAVVIPYYERWMQHFPTVKDLAEASENQVLKLWEGLGYYSRARNLHQGSKLILEKFEGNIPNTEKELAQIKGLGPYTIGAILSFAFHQRIAAVDGNVLRVFARHNEIKDDISQSKNIQTIRKQINDLLPTEESWIINEALIELGATICGRNPNCVICPIKNTCQSYSKGITNQLPYKAPRKAATQLRRLVAIVLCEDALLLRKGQKRQLMEGLYEFPYFELGETVLTAEQSLHRIGQELKIAPMGIAMLDEEKHAFTRYRVSLFPYFVRTTYQKKIEGYEWTHISTLGELAFSSGHRRVLKKLQIHLSK